MTKRIADKTSSKARENKSPTIRSTKKPGAGEQHGVTRDERGQEQPTDKKAARR